MNDLMKDDIFGTHDDIRTLWTLKCLRSNYDLSGTDINASSLSSKPLPRPSRAHSPPKSSNIIMPSLSPVPLSLAILPPSLVSISRSCPQSPIPVHPVCPVYPDTRGICGGGSATEQFVNDERGIVAAGVEARRSV